MEYETKNINGREKEFEDIRKRPNAAALIRRQLTVVSPLRATPQRPSFCALLKTLLLDWIMNLNAYGLPKAFKTNYLILKIIWLVSFLAAFS